MMELWAEPVCQAIVRSLEECVLVLDTDGRVRAAFCSKGNYVPLGDVELAANARIGDLFPVDVAGAFRLAIRSLERTGLAQTVNYKLAMEGESRHYSARLAVPALEGAQPCILVAIRDVTRQMLAQQSMLESEAFYRLLAENSTDVIVVEDLDGTYRYVSPSVTRLTGHDPDEVIGRQREEFINADDLEAIRQRTPEGELVPKPQGSTVQFRLRRKEGSWVWAESSVRAVEWNGRPALLSTVRDIAARVEADEALRQAHRQAEAASRAKSAFLASISHDLRTPLHGILGMSELMEQTHLTPEQQEYITAIRESGDTLLSRLNDLLDLSRIESGDLGLSLVDFDLVEAVEGLLDMLGSQAAAKRIDLFCHVESGVPPVVQGDPQRLRQVLLNLIDTSIKLSDRGEVDVRVNLLEDARLRFTVRATGITLPRDQLDHILGRPVPKEARSRWRPAVTTGLGLTVARQLVQLMGGRIQLEPQEQGVMFSFELGLPASDRAQVELQQQLLAGRRILATDDNATNRQLLREYLESVGATVELTSGGVETIRSLLDDPDYHCVILNANLPDLDGFATAAMVRANRRLERLPLVLMISSAETHEVRRSKELQVNAVLTRPVRRDVLVRAVHEVITSGEFGDAAAPAQDTTVLVVEDNEVNLRLARDILRRAGYLVVSAKDGHEALRQLERHRVDAVLMDIQLPDMDGLEATQRIRATEQWAEIPVIAMTAHAMKGDSERFVAAGADDCLSKPVKQDRLLSCLEQVLARRKGSD